jgi:hypothetical protein
LFHSKNICPLLFLTKEEKGRRGFPNKDYICENWVRKT